MSKMSDMAMTIGELHTAAAAIKGAADWLAQQFGSEAPEAAAENFAPEPEAKPVITLEQVRAVLADKSRAGHTTEVRTLLQKYGADRLSQIDPANYEALLRGAEGLANAT